MKGLFLKDYYLFIKRCRSLLVIMAFTVIMPLLVPTISMYTYYPTLIISLTPMTLLAYDEKDKWNQYAATMPYSNKDIVVEKYLFGLIISAIVIVLTVGAKITVGVVKNQFEIISNIELAVSLTSVCLVAPSVLLPFVFRYGVEKGRIAYYCVIGVVCGVIFSMLSMVNSLMIFEKIGKSFGIYILAGSIVLYIISLLLSVKFFEKRKTL